MPRRMRSTRTCEYGGTDGISSEINGATMIGDASTARPRSSLTRRTRRQGSSHKRRPSAPAATAHRRQQSGSWRQSPSVRPLQRPQAERAALLLSPRSTAAASSALSTAELVLRRPTVSDDVCSSDGLCGGTGRGPRPQREYQRAAALSVNRTACLESCLRPPAHDRPA